MKGKKEVRTGDSILRAVFLGRSEPSLLERNIVNCHEKGKRRLD